MEKNILTVGAVQAKPNPDLQEFNNEFDNSFVNCFFEVYQESQTDSFKAFAIKRPGVSSTATASPTHSTTGLGCFAAQPYNTTNVYFANTDGAGNYAYIWHWNGSDVTSVTGIANSLIPTYKRVNFVNIGLPDDDYTCAWTGQDYLYLAKDRSASINFQPTGESSARLTRPVYLNNRVFVGDQTTGQIWQSDAGDYTSFSASEWITVESYGGKLVDLCRYNNFVVAFKEYSMEFFEDVANLNGSVLGRNGQALQQIGCLHPNTIVDTGSGELIWLSTDESGEHDIKRLTNSFQVDGIASEHLKKMLNLIHNYDGCHAYLLNANGHQFYVLNIKQTYLDQTHTSDPTNITFVYDLQTKLWSNWRRYGEDTVWLDGDFNRATPGIFAYSGACRNTTNTTYVQDYHTGKLHQIDDSIFKDQGDEIYFIVSIARIDFGTFKRKFLNRVTIYTDYVYNNYTDPPYDNGEIILGVDKGQGIGPYQRTLSVQPWEFGNYATWALGSGRRFTISVVCQDNIPLRISAINVDYDIGEGYGLS